MYEELVKRLRSVKDSWQTEEENLMLEAADAIEELEFACNRYEKDYKDLCAYLPKWIPVGERLPEEKINPHTHDFEPIICSTNFGDVRVYKYGTPIGWNEPHFWNGAGIMDWYVTHWMNLPAPPKGMSDEKHLR